MDSNFDIVLKKYDIEDISSLQELLNNTGFDFKNKKVINNDMGIDVTVLSIILPAVSTLSVAIIEVIKTWTINRNVEFTIKSKSGGEITIKSQNGKGINNEDIEKIINLLEK